MQNRYFSQININLRKYVTMLWVKNEILEHNECELKTNVAV